MSSATAVAWYPSSCGRAQTLTVLTTSHTSGTLWLRAVLLLPRWTDSFPAALAVEFARDGAGAGRSPAAGR